MKVKVFYKKSSAIKPILLLEGLVLLISLGLILIGKTHEAILLVACSLIGITSFIGTIDIVHNLLGKSTKGLFESSERPLIIDKVEHNRKTYKLKIPITLDAELNPDNSVSLSYVPLDLYSHGTDIFEAIRDFNCEFAYSYRRIKNMKPWQLSKKLNEVKKFMENFV